MAVKKGKFGLLFLAPFEFKLTVYSDVSAVNDVSDVNDGIYLLGAGMKEKQRKGTIYFRGPEELATYDKLKAEASSLGISFSDHVKNILKDPLWFLKKPKLFVKTLYEFLSGDYDF
ncbi:hypothetical protein CW705_02220 [Candidatus Bathyarchaeota archaeon]|mgnify:CR=1 FL=1|nr:MAG: hypothetical protein CW705_02220 [Candidatus Bathyarchaeota archaeon]